MASVFPSQLGSIRNFAWVIPDLLARGEQPELELANFLRLRETGVSAVLSLRPDREAPSASARRPWPEYHVEEERRLVEQAGMRFAHVPLEDFSAPPPERLAAALCAIDELVQHGDAVYVHCRAGAGRAGLVSGAWGVTRGLSGDDAADSYLRFMVQIAETFGYTDAQAWPTFAKRVGQPYIWWAMREVVAALGSPITRHPPRLLAPEKPPDADHWEDGYRDLLARWRRS